MFRLVPDPVAPALRGWIRTLIHCGGFGAERSGGGGRRSGAVGSLIILGQNTVCHCRIRRLPASPGGALRRGKHTTRLRVSKTPLVLWFWQRLLASPGWSIPQHPVVYSSSHAAHRARRPARRLLSPSLFLLKWIASTESCCELASGTFWFIQIKPLWAERVEEGRWRGTSPLVFTLCESTAANAASLCEQVS